MMHGCGARTNHALKDDKTADQCPVQAKVAKSRIRLRVTLRSPDLGCESLPGFGFLVAKNVLYVGAARGGGGVRRYPGAGVFRGRLPGAGGRGARDGAGG